MVLINYQFSKKLKPLENDKFNHLINILILPLGVCLDFPLINGTQHMKFSEVGGRAKTRFKFRTTLSYKKMMNLIILSIFKLVLRGYMYISDRGYCNLPPFSFLVKVNL